MLLNNSFKDVQLTPILGVRFEPTSSQSNESISDESGWKFCVLFYLNPWAKKGQIFFSTGLSQTLGEIPPPNTPIPPYHPIPRRYSISRPITPNVGDVTTIP
jgi:hypothetical protein